MKRSLTEINMLQEDDYKILKSSLVESQRLIYKLHHVCSQAKDLDYDESGLYQEDEERLQRHWLKLSSKIVDKLSESLNSYKIELLSNNSLEVSELKFNIIKDKQVSKILVEYNEENALSITQLS